MAGIPTSPPPQEQLPKKSNRQAMLEAQATTNAQVGSTDPNDTARAAGVGLPEDPYPTASGSTPRSHSPDDPGADARVDVLDPDARHQQRLAWYYGELARQASNRREMAIDEGYYDNEGINAEKRAVLEARGQDPVQYNEIGPTIDVLIGTERRSHSDFYVVAQDDDEESADDAITKTKLLKYLDDVNSTPFERSLAAEGSFKAGLGILEIGLRGDKEKAPIYKGAVSWRNFLHDSRAKMDQSDARFNFRMKEVDLDIAICLFPQHEAALRAASTAGESVAQFKGAFGINGSLAGFDSFNDVSAEDGKFDQVADLWNSRARVPILECWSREPMRNPLHQVGMGDPITFKIRVALMTETTTLLEAWSPFKHGRFPFVLYWAYRNSRTGMPYSPIRRLRGPQDGLNTRMNRAIFDAAFNQTEMEEGALNDELMDIEEYQDEKSDPNGIMIYAKGGLAKARHRENSGAAREQIALAEGDRAALREMSGVNEQNRGIPSGATSRVAMDALAERGSVGTAQLFDQQLLARQQEGEMTLSLAEQFIQHPMTIRVAGESGAGQFQRTKINEPSHYEQGPDGETVPVYKNDIGAREAHFVVGEQAWKQSYAEAAFDSLMQVLTQLASSAPQIVVGLLDVVFDMHPNLPKKKVVVERIRAINGQTDPDGKITPEQQQAAAQKAQIAKAHMDLQLAQLKEEVNKTQAQGEKLSTDAILARVTALYESAQTAQVLALAPGITAIADRVYAAAGGEDRGGVPQVIDPAGVAPPPQNADQAAVTTTQGRMQALIAQQQAASVPIPHLQQADGAARGIVTPRADGVQMPHPGVMR